jgi:hypothetical protein
MLSNANRFARKIKSKLVQRIANVSVPDTPHFDTPGSTYFLERISQSNFFLEYGCGGSTIAAARLRKRFISVESDRLFFNATRSKLTSEFGSISGRLIHANIGMTGGWGYPLFKHQTPRRLKRWANYATIPWAYIEPGRAPDLILIDGRFRVHCALYSIKQMQNRTFEILIDDYADRPYYHEVEKFARLEAMRGRMAVFKPTEIDANALAASIEIFSRDFR